jgi:hypothetical protein
VESNGAYGAPNTRNARVRAELRESAQLKGKLVGPFYAVYGAHMGYIVLVVLWYVGATFRLESYLHSLLAQGLFTG